MLVKKSNKNSKITYKKVTIKCPSTKSTKGTLTPLKLYKNKAIIPN